MKLKSVRHNARQGVMLLCTRIKVEAYKNFLFHQVELKEKRHIHGQYTPLLICSQIIDVLLFNMIAHNDIKHNSQMNIT